MNVAQNIAFGFEMQGLDRKTLPARVDEMLARVQMEYLTGCKPAQWSGGQQQRVALARALAVVLTLLALIAIALGIMGYISLLPRNACGGVDWQAQWQLAELRAAVFPGRF